METLITICQNGARMHWNRKERSPVGWRKEGSGKSGSLGEESRVIFEEEYLSSGLALRQHQLLDEDNRGHLARLRNRPQLAKVKPIPILFFLEGLCKEVLNSNKGPYHVYLKSCSYILSPLVF